MSVRNKTRMHRTDQLRRLPWTFNVVRSMKTTVPGEKRREILGSSKRSDTHALRLLQHSSELHRTRLFLLWSPLTASAGFSPTSTLFLASAARIMIVTRMIWLHLFVLSPEYTLPLIQAEIVGSTSCFTAARTQRRLGNLPNTPMSGRCPRWI